MNISLNTLYSQVSQTDNANKVFGYAPEASGDKKTEGMPQTPSSMPQAPGSTPLADRKVTVLTDKLKTDGQFRTDLFRALSAGRAGDAQYLQDLRGKLGLDEGDKAVVEKNLQGREIKDLIDAAKKQTSKQTMADIDKLYVGMPMNSSAKSRLSAFASENMENETVQEFLNAADKDLETRFRALAKLAEKALDDQLYALSQDNASTRAYLGGVISAVRLLFDGVSKTSETESKQPLEQPVPKKPDEVWADAYISDYAQGDENALFDTLIGLQATHLDRLPQQYRAGEGSQLSKEQRDKLQGHWKKFQEQLPKNDAVRQGLRDLYNYTHGALTTSSKRCAALARNVIFKAFCEHVKNAEAQPLPKSPDLKIKNDELHKDTDIGLLKEDVTEILKHKAHAQTKGGNRCQMLATINALLMKDFGKGALRERLQEVEVEFEVPDDQKTTTKVKKKGYNLCNPAYDKNKSDPKVSQYVFVSTEEINNFDTAHPDFPKGMTKFEKMLCLAVLQTRPDSFDKIKMSTIEDIPPLFGLTISETIGSQDGSTKTSEHVKGELRQVQKLLQQTNQVVTLRLGAHFVAVTDVYADDNGDCGVIYLDSLDDKPTYKQLSLAKGENHIFYVIGEPSSGKEEQAWTLGAEDTSKLVELPDVNEKSSRPTIATLLDTFASKEGEVPSEAHRCLEELRSQLDANGLAKSSDVNVLKFVYNVVDQLQADLTSRDEGESKKSDAVTITLEKVLERRGLAPLDEQGFKPSAPISEPQSKSSNLESPKPVWTTVELPQATDETKPLRDVTEGWLKEVVGDELFNIIFATKIYDAVEKLCEPTTDSTEPKPNASVSANMDLAKEVYNLVQAYHQVYTNAAQTGVQKNITLEQVLKETGLTLSEPLSKALSEALKTANA